MPSLSTRLLVAASVVLTAFLGLTGLTLDQAFRDSALVAVQDQLQAQVYMLLGAADLDEDNRLTLPEALPEARFSSPDSGLYAWMLAADGAKLWHSDSMLGLEIASPFAPATGEWRFQEISAPDGQALFALGFTVSWEIGPDSYRRYTFQVAESRQGFDAQVEGFRRSLWGWLVAVAVVLLAVQGLILRWGLRPLRQVAHELREIEAGRQSELTGRYPQELRPLTENLNALIRQSRTHLERHRNALGDLAHSLKTPLAVLQGAVDSEASATALRTTLQEQVERMNQTVEYQLQRAAASGQVALAAPVALAPAARKIADSLAKVYRDKGLRFELQIEPSEQFYGDEGDIMEILGNLADNACKWAKSRVAVHSHILPEDTLWMLEVEDDGPGIPEPERQAILNRGERADPNTAGHGIGLAVVRDIVEEVYRGKLEIDSGALGGARVRVSLPISPL